MPSPFPGMDPYLESRELCPDVHDNLINVIREQLNPNLIPKYLAELQTQIVIDRIIDDSVERRGALPDVGVTQTREGEATYEAATAAKPSPVQSRLPVPVPTRLVSIHILRRADKRLVTVIEVLSPVNKRRGAGRDEYLEKRASYLSSGIHLVEIDLLRNWPRMPFDEPLPDSDYLIMVANAYNYPACDVWPISVQQALPEVPIPLIRPDPPVELDLGQALSTAYDRARYDLRADYSKPPPWPLSEPKAEWARNVIQKAT